MGYLRLGRGMGALTGTELWCGQQERTRPINAEATGNLAEQVTG
jgi:hypothetical protein